MHCFSFSKSSLFPAHVCDQHLCEPYWKYHFFAPKIFFWCNIICFCRHEILFCATSIFLLLTWNTFSCNINTFLLKQYYFLCKSNCLFQHKIIFHVTPNFCFRHSGFTLRIVIMLIFFVVVLETKKLLTIFYSLVWYIPKQ